MEAGRLYTNATRMVVVLCLSTLKTDFPYYTILVIKNFNSPLSQNQIGLVQYVEEVNLPRYIPHNAFKSFHLNYRRGNIRRTLTFDHNKLLNYTDSNGNWWNVDKIKSVELVHLYLKED